MTKNLTSGVLAVVLGLAYLAGTFNIPVFETGDSIGPRSFPFLVAALTISCGLALIVSDLRSADRKPFSWGFVAEGAVWLRILATIAVGITYGLVLDWLGYLIATFFFMIIVTSLINVGRHKQNVIIAVAFSIISFVSFALILKLSLPRGLLGGVLPF
jgi:putative tricarboxylic transport membrane protein